MGHFPPNPPFLVTASLNRPKLVFLEKPKGVCHFHLQSFKALSNMFLCEKALLVEVDLTNQFWTNNCHGIKKLVCLKCRMRLMNLWLAFAEQKRFQTFSNTVRKKRKQSIFVCWRRCHFHEGNARCEFFHFSPMARKHVGFENFWTSKGSASSVFLQQTWANDKLFLLMSLISTKRTCSVDVMAIVPPKLVAQVNLDK